MDRLLDTSVSFASHLDGMDPLSGYRSFFHIPIHNGNELVYFCGNSLGLQPKSVENAISAELDRWKNRGVEAWFEGDESWLSMHERMIPSLTKIVGAKDSEIAIMNSLSVNLHLLLASFYRPLGKRTRILMEKDAFPSDHHVISSQIRWNKLDPTKEIIYIESTGNEHFNETNAIINEIRQHQEELALVFLGGLNYFTGQYLDIASIAAECKKYGIVVGLDLAHAVGNVRLELHNWGVDFAAWCTYKYLNSGPGGPGGIFVHENQSRSNPLRLTGWWGHDENTRFEMSSQHIPMTGAQGWQISTPQILNFVGLQESLKIFDTIGMKKIEEKRIKMNEYFDGLLLDLIQKGKKLNIITPSAINERGAQISLVITDDARKTFDTLIKKGIIGDWREPDVIRLSPAPLYNSFKEIHKVYQTLMDLL